MLLIVDAVTVVVLVIVVVIALHVSRWRDAFNNA